MDPLDGHLLDRLRAVCLALPGVEERLNHGAATFGVAKRPAFCNLHEHRPAVVRPRGGPTAR